MPVGQVQTFVLNQKLISLTGDLWIEDGQGNHAFEVDGKLVSLHGTHVLKDLNGQPLYEISKPLAPHLHKTIEIKKDGQVSATVQEAIFHLGGDKFKITLAGGQELTVHGNWSNREFQVKDQAGGQVIDASRKWFSIHDAYGIQIAPGFEVPLGLAICVALERVEAQEQGDESPFRICSATSARSEPGLLWATTDRPSVESAGASACRDGLSLTTVGSKLGGERRSVTRAADSEGCR